MRPALVNALVGADRSSLTLAWNDGVLVEVTDVWLRDNLPEDRDRHSGQRLVDVADLPADPKISDATLDGDGLKVMWAAEQRVTCFAEPWLYAELRAGARPEHNVRHWLEGGKLHARADFAWLTLPALRADAPRRLHWLTRLAQDGIAFLSGVPCTEEGILEAMRPVGRVAETNYGLVFDVRAVPKPENLAYSDRGLGLHTDNPYREPVPGFQALHTLLAAPDGGDSLFADGWALAAHLKAAEPGIFATLTNTLVPFHYRSAQADLYAERPLIELDCAARIIAVHYNSRSIAPLRLPAAECRVFYAAYRRFGELLRDARWQARLRLEPGELVLFDNQRILHGRTGFASAAHARHLRGCYLTRDSVYSEIGLLRRQREGES